MRMNDKLARLFKEALSKIFIQGDHSACSKPPVDIDLKVVS